MVTYAKWYQSVKEKIRVSATWSIRIAIERQKIPV